MAGTAIPLVGSGGMRRATVLAITAGTLALGWFVMAPERIRYRMTVDVETPQGIRSGSAVREIITRTPPPIPMLGEDRGSVSVRGEAVAVDLPDGRTLFALMKGANGSADYAGQDVKSLLKQLGGLGFWGKPVELWPAMPRTRTPEIGNPLPLLVIFRDIADPKSVERIDPAVIGVKRILVETTNDSITTGIEKRVKWLGKLRGGYLSGGFTSRGAPLGLTGTAFSTEIR